MEQGESRIGQELDIIRFIRRQKMYEIAMKSLFTRIELFLIKNQFKHFVLKGTRDPSESVDSSDWEPTSFQHEPRSRHFNKLIEGVYPKARSI